jgi:hypothetical protein
MPEFVHAVAVYVCPGGTVPGATKFTPREPATVP